MAPAGRPPGGKSKVREEGKSIEKYMTGEKTETKNMELIKNMIQKLSEDMNKKMNTINESVKEQME